MSSVQTLVSRVFNKPLQRGKSPRGDAAARGDSPDDDLDLNLGLLPRDNILRRCDSRMIAMLSHELRQAFPDKDINPRLVFDNPTIESLSGAIGRLPSRSGTLTSLEAGVLGAPAMQDVPVPSSQPFTQFMDVFCKCSEEDEAAKAELAFFERIRAARRGGVYATGREDFQFYRLTDGMESLLIPGAACRIGTDGIDSDGKDLGAFDCECPSHDVELSTFLMDIEPVSVGAFVRFLNMVSPPPTPEMLLEWCLLEEGDERACHVPLMRMGDGTWQARHGIPLSWPMILVSWYGANAYSLWAHGRDYRSYRSGAQSFLPTEAQWEYAARGATMATFPWGNAPARPGFLNVCWDASLYGGVSDVAMDLKDLPLQCVNVELGMSPFGLRGMAGNVWQWCRDTFNDDFYITAAASQPDACNVEPGTMKSERGGSWVGPATLARSSHRRGRAPEAKGRCLGFRCCAPAAVLDEESTAPSTGGVSEVWA